MASAMIPAPGTQYGPCSCRCNHPDCRTSRGMSEQECAICHQRIGYETQYYRDRWSTGVWVYTHARCSEDAVLTSKEKEVAQ